MSDDPLVFYVARKAVEQGLALHKPGTADHGLYALSASLLAIADAIGTLSNPELCGTVTVLLEQDGK